MKEQTRKILDRIIAILAVGFLLALTFIYLGHKKPCPPDGYVLVSQEFIDSLQAIAEMPPEVIVKDSVVYVDNIIYVSNEDPVPEPDPIDPELNCYRDSVVNDSVNVWVEIKTRGVVEQLRIGYKPIIHIREITINQPAPYPVIEEVEVPVTKPGLIVRAGLGYGFAQPLGAIELDYMKANRWLFGVEYIRGYQDWGVIIKGGYKFNLK